MHSSVAIARYSGEDRDRDSVLPKLKSKTGDGYRDLQSEARVYNILGYTSI